ncbi:lysine-rich arabinogalactan protein 19-like [Solanum pennellii]|uniref:Lysine-rich arabinogalactan protein 19-like n=1 Tax=Solanum pennellii TaxID=28526 RepID=A0ABM1GLV3_SOLPN|nr:lysine-rich arabinogalactan protein 19-like [Solanum pennellii]
MVNPLVAYSDDESSSDSAFSQREENPVVDAVPNLGEESQLPTKPSTPKSDPSTSPSPKAPSPPPPVKEASPPVGADSPSPPIIESPSPPIIESPPPPVQETPLSPVQETPLSPVQETPLSPNPETPTTTVPNNPPSSPSHKTTTQNPPPSPITDDILLSTLHPKKPRRLRKHIAVKQVRQHRPVTRSANVVKSTDDATSGVKRWRLAPQSKSKSAKRNADKFLKVRKKKYFQTKAVLRGRTFHPDILSMDKVKQEVVDFYTNLVILEGDVVSSSVKGVDIVFDATKLGEILHIPSVGINEYNWEFSASSTSDASISLCPEFVIFLPGATRGASTVFPFVNITCNNVH